MTIPRPWATPYRIRELQLRVILKRPTDKPLTERQRLRALRKEAKGRQGEFWEADHGQSV